MAPLMGSHHLMRPGGGRGVLVSGSLACAPPASSSSAPVWRVSPRPPWRWACTPRFSSWTATSTACERWTTISAASSRRSPPPSTPLRRSASRPTSSSGRCWSSAPGHPAWSRTRWSRRCGTGRSWSTSRWTRAVASSPPGPTTHSDPTFEVHGSVFYCVANMPGAVPHTSTHALANATLALHAPHRQPGVAAAVRADPALAEGVNVVDGQVVYKPVADAHGMGFTPLASCSTDAPVHDCSLRQVR